LHGFPLDGSIWDKIKDELSLTFTHIIPDLPGSGSSVLEKPAGMGEMADCVKAVLEAESIERCVLAGHSMGGYVGCEFVSRFPANVAGFSLIHSIPLPDDTEKKDQRSKSIKLIRKGGKKQFIAQLIPNLFSDSFKQSFPLVIEQQMNLACETDDESLINFCNAMIERRDHSETLKNADFPLQWIVGLNDNVIFYKKILELCYKSDINSVTFKKICGHMSMLETPLSLIADLKEFTNYCYNHYDYGIIR
jgi:pimeloyl-ACP methyl ester carboxylesterase